VVGLVAVGAVYWYGLLRYALLISITLFLIIIMPSVIWKMNSYGGGMMESLLTPLPGGWPGTDNFENMLRNYKDNTVIWPLSLLVPGSIGFVSTIIGISALGFFLIVPDKDISLRIIFISAIFVFFVSAIVGPSSSRSYLEPIIWVTVGLANQNPTILFKLFDKRYALTPILLQYIFTITMLYYGVVNSISGAFSKSARTEIMETLADGYELMRWVDQVLPTNAVLLSYHMSTALVPRKNMSLRWIIYTNDNKLVYLDLIKEKKVTHLLVMADDYRDSVHYSMFSNCIGHIMYGPKIFFQATRNPFNRGDEQNAWLFDIDSEKLPGCISARL